jgi:hypothetical protein
MTAARRRTPAKEPETLSPHSPEAEVAVLGAALQDRTGLEQAAATLRPADFFLDAHRQIFSAALALFTQGAPVDILSVGELLQRRDQLQAVGGTSSLADLVEQVPSVANIAYYCGIVRDKAGLRRIAEVCTLAACRARNNGGDPGAVLADLWENLRPLESPDGCGGPVLIGLDEVTSKPVTWFWPGRIPQGKLTLIVGDPGLGKSFLTIDLAARSSQGAPWPDGEPSRTSDVVILTAEDGLSDTVRPRLDALGGNPARVHILVGVGDAERPASFNLARDIPHLEDAILRTGASLVVIDPLSAYLAGVDSHKDADVRSILAPLAAMAERNGVAVVSVVHMNKSQQRQALYRAQGSLAFVAAARAIFGVAEDQETPNRRLFVPLKMNLAAHPPGLAFRLDGGRLTWDQGTVAVDADSAMGGWEVSADRTEREEATDFLREILANGPLSASEVERQRKAAGIAERTLKRAKAEMHVKVRKETFGGGWVWELDTKEATIGPLDTRGPLRPSSAELAPFEEGHGTEEGHEEGHTLQMVAPLGER